MNVATLKAIFSTMAAVGGAGLRPKVAWVKGFEAMVLDRPESDGGRSRFETL